MIELNKVYNENCLDTMGRMEDCFVDLTVTSPPYDNLRQYKDGVDKTWGESVWKPIIKELHRVTKEGGVVVWIVSDATIDGSESGTRFKQALWAMECGFNLHDTMIWCKDGGGAIGSNYTYTQNFEYMFVWSKGTPKTINLIYDKQNLSFKERHNIGRNSEVKIHESRGGKDKGDRGYSTYKPNEMSRRNNWWYMVPHRHDGSKFHPAVFPEELCRDHRLSWSNEGEIVYDPFMGSGTTAKMSQINNRKWIGSEISEEYCKKIEKRIATNMVPRLF